MKIVDARRLFCPMPVIRLQEAVEKSKASDMIEVLCTDPGALHDIPAWCRVHGHEVIGVEQASYEIRITVRTSHH